MLRSHARRGANAIEFGLTLPIFIALTFGMIEFGWYFSRQAQVNGALLDGCREGALIDPNRGSPVTTAQTAMTARLAAMGLGCSSCTAQLFGTVPTRSLRCVAVAPHPGLTGLLAGVLPTEVAGATDAILEWQR